MMNHAWTSVWTAVVCAAGLACGGGASDRTASDAAGEADGGHPLVAFQHGDTVLLSLRPGEPASNTRDLTVDLRVEGLLQPTDVTGFAGDSFAVLDRMDAAVVVFDPEGRRVRSFGREGEGPGEYHQPYAITAFRGDRFAVWDRRGRVTVLRSDGSVAGTNSRVPGDARALAQRLPTTQWEEPFQVSREDVSQRLGRLGDAHFTLRIQDDERFDESFMTSGGPRRFTQRVILVDSLAEVVDTLQELPGPELKLAVPASDVVYGMAAERPFARRPFWAAGDGWTARGHGADAFVTVRFDDGRTLVVRWPRDDRPLSTEQAAIHLEWELEGRRRTRGDAESAREIAALPPHERRRLREERLADIVRRQGGLRPQVMGLLAAGSCLALVGFDPDGGPHGESTRIVLVNVRDSGEVRLLRPRSDDPGFVRTLTPTAVFRIAVRENGTRVVERFPLPFGGCGASRGEGDEEMASPDR